MGERGNRMRGRRDRGFLVYCIHRGQYSHLQFDSAFLKTHTQGSLLTRGARHPGCDLRLDKAPMNDWCTLGSLKENEVRGGERDIGCSQDQLSNDSDMTVPIFG
jgi:hypothetical protein